MPDPREHRLRHRVRLELQARIRQIAPPRNLTEVVRTLDVSRNGLLFRTRERYDLRSTVWVMMPYNPNAVLTDPEFPATVVRVDLRQDGNTEVAVQFHSARADYIPSTKPAAVEPAASRERRTRSRVRMALPVRMRHGNATDESVTFDVSRNGVLVKTSQAYPVGQTVWVVMPYQPNAPAEEVPARVVRYVERQDVRGVALQFTSATSPVSYGR